MTSQKCLIDPDESEWSKVDGRAFSLEAFTGSLIHVLLSPIFLSVRWFSVPANETCMIENNHAYSNVFMSTRDSRLVKSYRVLYVKKILNSASDRQDIGLA